MTLFQLRPLAAYSYQKKIWVELFLCDLRAAGFYFEVRREQLQMQQVLDQISHRRILVVAKRNRIELIEIQNEGKRTNDHGT